MALAWLKKFRRFRIYGLDRVDAYLQSLQLKGSAKWQS
jgi:hypothetical protein